ncbi:hypothetical protein [Magnetospirillum sp. UT-4]|uniref:DUF433 domain-containing protein n=1 Tax=Magnetospirillum sp. UT-4 TaxID=2681467 RepID=UPI0013833A22|nr:hypothetical protein [Magnetospirillum sp. UT-4]CAA7613478.1 conserved hypothetical protein [Magnetospirillum sp. UT-4]
MALNAQPAQFLGIGLYSVPEASRLTRVPATKIRGWINGYSQRATAGGRSAPLIHRQVPTLEGKPALGFLDLLEVKFVNWLANYGVTWHSIRVAADRARGCLNHDHPFALARFHTDGKAIFLETQEETGDRKLMDLTKNNFAMYEVLEQSFREGIEFNAQGVASIWHPSPQLPHVVLDPERSFGRPIDAPSGVPTATLSEAYEAEGSFERVAAWFEVSPETVRDAVAFELGLSA